MEKRTKKKKNRNINDSKTVSVLMNSPLKHQATIKRKNSNKKKSKIKPIQGEALNNDSLKLSFKQRKILHFKEKLNVALNSNLADEKPKKKKVMHSLRERMIAKLHSARFRYLNEQIYSNDSRNAQNMFKTDPDAFKAYHEGYRQQVQKWPMNPLDIIIQSVQKM